MTGSGGHAPELPSASDPLPEGEEKRRMVRGLFDSIAPRYDLLNRMMTLGMDVRWRRLAVRGLGLPPGSLVLDLACGTGDMCEELSRAGHRPVGVDFSHGMLLRARTDAPLVEADILRLPLPDGSVDGVTCGFAIRNVVSADALFDEIARVLRPGGRIALLEATEPSHPLVRAAHGVYFGKVVPWLGARFSDGDAYAYLPRSLSYLPPPDGLVAMLRVAGFPNAWRRSLAAGAVQVFAGTRGTGTRGAGAGSGTDHDPDPRGTATPGSEA